MKHQTYTDKGFVYFQVPYESKYRYLIKKAWKVYLKHFNDPKIFMEYSNDMKDIYITSDEYNPR